MLHLGQPEDLLDAQLAVQLSFYLLLAQAGVPILVQQALRGRHQRPAQHSICGSDLQAWR